jgi:hypothetical protein
MSAPTVTIDCFSATLRLHELDADPTATRDRFDSMIGEIRHGRLDHAVRRMQVGDGHWCVRRIDVPLRLDEDSTDAALSERWAEQLADALASLVHEHPSDVVHYSRDLDVVVDALASLASGRTDRIWAWRQAGSAALSDVSDPRRAVLAALHEQPTAIAAAVAAASRQCGIARIDRLLGAEGWASLAVSVTSTVAGTPPILRGSGFPALEASDPASSDRWGRRADATVARSRIAQRLAASGLRLDAARARSLAMLVVAEAEPAALQQKDGLIALIDAVAVRLLPAEDSVADRHQRRDSSAPIAADKSIRPGETLRPAERHDTRSPPEAAGGSQSHSGQAALIAHETVDDDSAAGARAPHIGGSDNGDPDETADRPALRMTHWAGLAFLLATADDAGLPSAVLDDEAFDEYPFAWVIHQLALRLAPVEAHDPGALALAGLTDQGARDIEAFPAPPAPAAARLDGLATSWATVTVKWLASASTSRRWKSARKNPIAAILPVLRRTGRVLAEPGWIDVHLDLDGVDIDVRRCGLDLDPGWIPWLGAVVRFRYE